MVDVEYLIAFDVEAGICGTVAGFKSLIKSNTRISISKSNITFEGDKFPFKIYDGDIEEGKLKYFHLTVSSEEEKIKELHDLCREIRGITGKVCEGNKVQILWDGIGFTLCKNAYPVIYEVENLLRKLLTKFMLCNIGLSWHKESIPDEVKKSIKNKSDKNSANCLYKADFIQLSDFLFKPYSRRDVSQLFSKIGELSPSGTIPKSEIESFVPKSNWDRFFSDIISCEKGFIEKKWERLYKLRCIVAHNTQLSFSDFDEVCAISKELSPKFREAIENLEKVKIAPGDKEQAAESLAMSRGDSYRDFLTTMNDFNKTIVSLSKIEMPKITLDSSWAMKSLTKNLLDMALINRKTTLRLEAMEALRNIVVHNLNIKIPSLILDNKILDLNAIKDDIELKINSPKKSNKDANSDGNS